MKKFILILSMVLSISLLSACTKKEIDFTSVVPSELEINESFTVSAKDLKGVLIDVAKISVEVKSGNALVKVTGLKVEALASGNVVITIIYREGNNVKSKDFNFTIKALEIVYGLPTPEAGFYVKDADVIDASGTRYIAYTTNTTSGEEDNVIAIRKATFTVDKGYAYGNQVEVIAPSKAGWDQYISSPSIVKGNFKYNSTDYTYMMAYQGTKSSSENSFSIGLAVSNDPLGTWVKVGATPVVSYDAEVYGESYAGHYAPSLVNLNKQSIVRLFFTWADAYGHFTYFVDFDASNLGAIDLSGFAMVPNNGNLSSGDDTTMVPNADFAYDATNHIFYAVKDYSPTPSRDPKVATRIELAKINESELYTVTQGLGWQSMQLYDMFDTPDALYERLYSGSLVTDEYGHLISATKIEIIYNVSDLKADNADYVFSQHFLTLIHE